MGFQVQVVWKLKSQADDEAVSKVSTERGRRPMIARTALWIQVIAANNG